MRKGRKKEDSVFEFTNQFGTYEIQKTADTENAFPKIAQGLPNSSKDKPHEQK